MSNSLEYLFYIFIATVFVQVLYHVLIFLRIWFYKELKSEVWRPVSIIISSKNQIEQLKKNLPHYLKQDYRQFEVVVVNDASWDGTDDFLEELEKVHGHLKVVSNTYQENDRFSKGNKFALTLAIKAASYDTLLFSDADSYPSSTKWLQKMQASFTSKKKVVLSYSGVEKGKGLLNRLLRYESLYEGLLRFSFTQAGFPLLANRRNLAYDRNVFFSVNGFLSHLNLSRGSAELFVNEVSTSKNTNVCIGVDVMTMRCDEPTYLEWFKDKRAYFNFAKRFRFSSLFLLLINFISQLFFWLLVPILIVYKIELEFVLIAFALRLCLQYIVYWKMCKYCNEQGLLWFLPFYEIALMLIHFILYVSTGIKKVHNWD